MTQKMPINLIKGDKVSNKTDYRDFLPVNMFAIMKPLFGAAGYMQQFRGLTEFATPNGMARGAVWNERFGKHYRVNGSEFVEVVNDGTVTVLGTVAGTEPASMPYSFNTQAIVAGGNYYLYDPTIGFRQALIPNVGNPIDCVWVDGYYFFTDGEFVYHTNVNDETIIDSLQFATAEFMPDKSLGVGRTQDDKVVVFGRYSTEYFVNQATANFAFRRVDSRAIKIGIVGTHAKIEIEDRWFILGGRKAENVSVHILGVGSAEKIATREIDKIIGEYTELELSTSVLETLSVDAYTFLLVHLPDITLMFNTTLAKSVGIEFAWTILESHDSMSYRGIYCIFEPTLSKFIFGDKYENLLGFLDESSVMQYSELTPWVLSTPFIYLDGQSIDELEIETIPGFSGTDDATVFISFTYDGITYSTELIQLYGEPSNYNQKFIARRLGVVNDWFALKLRGLSRSRMAFGRAFITHG